VVKLVSSVCSKAAFLSCTETWVSLGRELKGQRSSYPLSLLYRSEPVGPYQQAEINCSHNYIVSKKTDAQILVL